MGKACRLLCTLLLMATSSIRAQDNLPATWKETVVVDYFLANEVVPKSNVDTLRQYILNEFANRKRQIVIDAAASDVLSAGLPDKMGTTTETAAEDLKEFLQLRAGHIEKTGARYLVSGAITDYRCEPKPLRLMDSIVAPLPVFEVTTHVLVSAYDMKSKILLSERNYSLTAIARLAQDADTKALGKIEGLLTSYIDRYFNFETTIRELGPRGKKGRVQQLYIHSEPGMGLKPGNSFRVYEIKSIAGHIARKELGLLRVAEVRDSTTLCNIITGNERITESFHAGQNLICTYRPKTVFGNLPHPIQ